MKDPKPEKLEHHTCIPDPEKLCDNQCLLVKVSRFGVILCIAMNNSNISSLSKINCLVYESSLSAKLKKNHNPKCMELVNFQ